MFRLFKKKEKPAPEVLNHEEMGELIYYVGQWQGKVESTVLGKKRELLLWVYVDEDDRYNLKEQEKTFRYYIRSKTTIEKDIELELRSAYELAEDYDINERFVPYALILHEGGYSGVVFNDEMADKWSNAYSIVVTVTPKVECFGSLDDYA